MTNALTKRESWEVMREQAGTLIKSGFLPIAVKTPEQAIAIMMKGSELGLAPMESFAMINVIQGKPTLAPQGMLALINRSGLMDDMRVADDGKSCTVWMKRKDREPHQESFSMEDAQRMQTFEKGTQIPLAEKYNWKQMPSVMRKWRAVSACARVVFPDIIAGMYTPEEMGATVDEETGEMILTKEVTPNPPATEVFRDSSQFVDHKGGPISPEISNNERAIADIREAAESRQKFYASKGQPDAAVKKKMLGLMDGTLNRLAIYPEEYDSETSEEADRRRHAFLSEVFNVDTSKDLKVDEIAGVLQWMGLEKKPGDKTYQWTEQTKLAKSGFDAIVLAKDIESAPKLLVEVNQSDTVTVG